MTRYEWFLQKVRNRGDCLSVEELAARANVGEEVARSALRHVEPVRLGCYLENCVYPANEGIEAIKHYTKTGGATRS
ncbi:MAG: hypothetical protein A2Y12_09860 [Planctomycetes bacterium GWF2_42_9]|nr:MAG: hypothetical protein A2Y12_09860 [Planctomycetes bacterium GWF2_42_9]